MTREQYVKYLQRQEFWLDHIAKRIEDGLPVDDYDWLVDIPLQTKFEEAPGISPPRSKHALAAAGNTRKRWDAAIVAAKSRNW